MPRWYRRDPHRLREAQKGLSGPAGRTLSDLADFVGVEGTMPGEILSHAGVPVTADVLALQAKIPLATQRRALDELRAAGYVKAGGGGTIVVTGGLLDLFPPPDTAADRKAKSRGMSRDTSRDEGVTDGVTGHVPSLKEEKRFRVPTLRSGTLARAAWVEPIADAVEALLKREMRELSPDERYTLARWHAFAFANCSRSEGTNRTRSRGIATGLLALTERIARHPAKRDLRVEEYLELGKRLVERSGGAPWYRPIEAETEIEVDA